MPANKLQTKGDPQALHNLAARDRYFERGTLWGVDTTTPVELGPPAAEEPDPNIPGSGTPGPNPREAVRLGWAAE